MATIYYKVETTWCAYPFQDEVDERNAYFYYRKKRRYILIPGLVIESNTTLEQKAEYIKKELSMSEVTIRKIK